MEDATQLAKRFREVYLDGKWIAQTNLKQALENISLVQATTRVGSLNTIAALTFHVNYYIAGLLSVFEGGSLEIRDKYSFDMPALETEEDWNHMKDTLIQTAEKFAGHVAQMSAEQLEAGFVKEEYGTYRRNIEAMIEHAYYHLGQISLLKKWITEVKQD
jgi:uncharacterized damage-inducible protein DinB